MHYGDDIAKKKQRLLIVVYKHSVLNGKFKEKKVLRKKNGDLSRSSVAYDVTSIQACRYFSPNLLKQIIQDPYKFFNEKLSRLAFESYYELEVVSTDGYTTIDISEIGDVTYNKNKLKQLH